MWRPRDLTRYKVDDRFPEFPLALRIFRERERSADRCSMAPSIGVNLRVTGHCNQGGRKYMEDVFSVAYQQGSGIKFVWEMPADGRYPHLPSKSLELILPIKSKNNTVHYKTIPIRITLVSSSKPCLPTDRGRKGPRVRLLRDLRRPRRSRGRSLRQGAPHGRHHKEQGKERASDSEPLCASLFPTNAIARA